MRQQQYRGFGFVLIMVMMLLIVMTFSRQVFINEDISYQEYLHLLDGDQVEEVAIRQNQQTPTGEVELKLKDGSIRQYNTSDVTVEQDRKSVV